MDQISGLHCTMITVEMFCIIAAASLSMLVVEAEMLKTGIESHHQNLCTSLLVSDTSIPLGNLKSWFKSLRVR